MRRHAAALALVLAVGSLTACADYTTTGVPQDSGSAAPAERAGAEQMQLEGTSWTLVDSSASEAGLDQFGVTAEFAQGSVSGHAPVNTYNATYQVEGDRITFGPVASTMMAGEPAAMAAEGAYFALLATVTGFEQSETTLVLLADQMPVLTFESGASTADPGVAEAAATQKVADAVVGKTAADAESAVTAAGLAYRVVSEDGSLLPVTMDYRVDRVNVVLVNGKVESASVG